MKTSQQNSSLHILLADDDKDDCFFFEKALKEIAVATHLTTLHDGDSLMHYLAENSKSLPDILFLDLSMPRKNGFECLTEIKADGNLKSLPVIVFSTSFARDMHFEQGIISMLHKEGAHHFIRKPGDFEQLKQIIQNALINVQNEIMPA